MNGYNNYQPAPQFGPAQGQTPPFSNVLLVDNLEQALRMPTRPHSEMVYWSKYKNEIYRIYTDYSNNKQYMVFDFKIQERPKEDKVPEQVDLSQLFARLDKIQANLEVLNEKYNVNADVAATVVSTDTATANVSATSAK